ncbi:MAG TPA: hypothetical protein V6C85_04740 [Allocoleopsis sp.]
MCWVSRVFSFGQGMMLSALFQIIVLSIAFVKKTPIWSGITSYSGKLMNCEGYSLVQEGRRQKAPRQESFYSKLFQPDSYFCHAALALAAGNSNPCGEWDSSLNGSVAARRKLPNSRSQFLKVVI